MGERGQDDREWVERQLTEQARYEQMREIVFAAMDAAWKAERKFELLEFTSDEIVGVISGYDSRVMRYPIGEAIHHIDGWFEAFTNKRREDL